MTDGEQREGEEGGEGERALTLTGGGGEAEEAEGEEEARREALILGRKEGAEVGEKREDMLVGGWGHGNGESGGCEPGDMGELEVDEEYSW